MELPLQNTSADLETWHRWLLFHYHCNECSQTEAACEYGELCAYGKLAFAHVRGCNRQSCSDPRCDLVKRILTHHHSCKELSCPVCAPVCKYQARSKSLPLPRPSKTPPAEFHCPPNAYVSHMPHIEPPPEGVCCPMQISSPTELTPRTGGSADVSKTPALSSRGPSPRVTATAPPAAVTPTMHGLPGGGLFAARQREYDRRLSCQATLLGRASAPLPGSALLHPPCGAASPSSSPVVNIRSTSMDGPLEPTQRSCSSSGQPHPLGSDHISQLHQDRHLQLQQQHRQQHHHHIAELLGPKEKPAAERGDAGHTAPQPASLASQLQPPSPHVQPSQSSQPQPHRASRLAGDPTSPFARIGVQLQAQGYVQPQSSQQQPEISLVRDALPQGLAAHGQQSVSAANQTSVNQQLEMCGTAALNAAHSLPQGSQPYLSIAYGPMTFITATAPPLQMGHLGAIPSTSSFPGGLMHTMMPHQTAFLAHGSSVLPSFAVSYPLHGAAHDVYGIGTVAASGGLAMGCGTLPVDGSAGGVAASNSPTWLACLPSSGQHAAFLQLHPTSALQQQTASVLPQASVAEPVGTAPPALTVVGTQ